MVFTYVLWDTCELWLYTCTETVRIRIEVTNLPWSISIVLMVIQILYSWCTDVQPTSNGLYICIVGYLGTKTVRLYNNCTKRDWGYKCSMQVFNPFSRNSDCVQKMYGRTSYFKYFNYLWMGPFICMEKHLAMVLRPYINCMNLNWYRKYSIHWFDQFGCHLHPVQLMYGRTANFKWSVHIYCGILGTMAVRLYGKCTNWDWGHKCSMRNFNPFGGK